MVQREDQRPTSRRKHTGASSSSSSSSSSRSRKKTTNNRNTCRPPPGMTYLTIGQDLFSIDEYLRTQYQAGLYRLMKHRAKVLQDTHDDNNNNDDDELRYTHTAGDYRSPINPLSSTKIPVLQDYAPAAVMVYSDLQTLRGLDAPTDYGSGVEYADGALQLLVNHHHNGGRTDPFALQLGLWLNGTQGCQDVVDGVLDDNIHQLVHYLGVKCPANKIFLRIGYEFDNPGFGYASDPYAYREAFQYITHRCRQHAGCRHKVIMVWHSWAAGLPNPDLTLHDFYPGDDVVDWIGISIFQQFYNQTANNNNNNNNGFVGGTVADLELVLRFAKQHDKPTMIAESTPFGGIHHNPHLHKNKNMIWDAWFRPTMDLIDRHNISMWSYINCNWDVQPLWNNTGFGDTRLSVDHAIMEKWYHEVLLHPRYVIARNDLLCMGEESSPAYDFMYSYDLEDDDDDEFGEHIDSIVWRHFGYRYDDYYTPPFHRNYRIKGDGLTETERGPYRTGFAGWLWGQEREPHVSGVWKAALPLAMLASSLALLYFLDARRKSGRRRKVRFASLTLDSDHEHHPLAAGGIGYTSNYGSVYPDCNVQRPVRRIGGKVPPSSPSGAAESPF